MGKITGIGELACVRCDLLAQVASDVKTVPRLLCQRRRDGCSAYALREPLRFSSSVSVRGLCCNRTAASSPAPPHSTRSRQAGVQPRPLRQRVAERLSWGPRPQLSLGHFEFLVVYAVKECSNCIALQASSACF